jgi:subtilisin family serine protease
MSVKFRVLTIVLLAIALQSTHSFAKQPENQKPVRGERPPIDIRSIPDTAFEKGIIRIRFSPEWSPVMDNFSPVAGPDGIARFGITAIDNLNTLFGVDAAPLTFATVLADSRFDERHRQWEFHLWFNLHVPENTDIRQMVTDYTALPEIAHAEPVYRKQRIANVANPGEPVQPNGSVGQLFTPNDPTYNQQWHYHNTGQQSGTVDADIDLPEAWDISTGNTAVIVAIIDGGIDYSHPDLAGNMWPGIGYNFVTNSSTVTADDHGTHVAGTVAANTNNGVGVSGVAGGSGSGNGARLMSCQVFTTSSSGGFENAPVWAANNGAAISQNSWGYTSAGVFEQSVLDAIDYFNLNGGGTVMTGGITIFAAGNSNASGQWYPGYYSGCYSVAATNNQDVKSWYSNYDTWVDISAPGGETNTVTARGVRSTLPGNSYGFYQGTSMACPHVSGVAALILSLSPNAFSPQQVKDILTNTTDNINAQNPSFIGKLGSGRMNAHQALLLAQSMLNPLIPAAPTTLTASAQSSTAINLAWTKNANNDNVLLAFNTTNTFGTPSGNYSPGQSITGGGTVLYAGNLTSFGHTGLSPATDYYYAIWSKNGDYYSALSRKAQATTLCETANLPLSENFSSSTIPVCWSQSTSGTGVVGNWSVSNTNNAGGTANEMRSAYQSVSSGTTRLVTRAINTLGISQINLSFRHMLDAFSTGVTLRIQSSADGVNWTNEAWSVAATATNIAATLVNTTVMSNLNSPNTYIAFTVTGNLYNYDYWYIDNVSISGVSTNTPSVTTSEVTGITTATATSGGNVTLAGASAVTARGVCWNTTGNPSLSDNYTTDGSGTGPFTSSLTGLSASTTYYVRAYATNSYGTSYGEQLSFQTPCGSYALPFAENFNTSAWPACWTQQATGTGAVNSWEVVNSANAGGSAYEMRSLWQSVNPGLSRLITPAINTTGQTQLALSFRHMLDTYSSGGLVLKIQSSNDGINWTDESWNMLTTSANIPATLVSTTITQNLNSTTTYIAFSISGNLANYDYWYIDNVSVAGVSSGLPTVTTTAISAITSSTATSGGNVTSDGGSTVTARGVCWSTSPAPTIANSFTTDGSGTGSFTSQITGLSPSTSYYVRAYATNTSGTAYGNELSFSTNCGEYTLPFTEGFSAAVLPDCWSIIDHQGSGQVWQFGTISGYTANPALTGNYAYLNSDGYGSTGEQNTDLVTPALNLSAYNTVNLAFDHFFRSWGSTSGTVSVSTDNGANWTPIQTFTTNTTNPEVFSQAVAAAAGQAQVKFKWNYTGAYGYYWAIDNISITGTQAPILPTVTTALTTNITASSAQSGGEVTAAGSQPVTARGVCWNTTGAPTLADNFTNDGSGTGPFTSNLTGLQPNTPYYVRAYATSIEGTAYGNEEFFTTSPPAASVTELVVPRYAGARTAATTNNARTPFAVCLQIDGLLPFTTYDIRTQLGLITEAATVYGAGNIWNGTEFAGNTLLNAFTTNATGSSGPFWVYYQPTGNGSRFAPGQQHNLRLGWVTSGNSFPAQAMFAGSKTITTLDIATTALTPETTDDGAFVKGTALPGAGGKFVLLFDNEAGTGNPLFSYQIRQTATTQASNSQLPPDINDVYIQSGGSAIGDYPAVIPTGANNPAGVRRVEARNADNTIFAFNTNPDGNWQSSGNGNTTTIGRRQVVYINATDAPLVPLPSVITAGISGITSASAISGGNVTSDGGSAVTQRGVCWNTTGSPTLSDDYTSDGPGTGLFASTLSGLSHSTVYYVRAYATNAYGTVYGQEEFFETSGLNKSLSVKVFLEGPYEGPAMLTTLAPYMPLGQPYQTAPWNYAGTETVAAIPADVTDWVLVELRDAPSPETAIPATTLPGWPRAFLLKSDGQITDLDGLSLPDIGLPAIGNNLYVIVRHRNHIDVLTANALVLNGNTYAYDFSTALAQAHGADAGYKEIAPGVFGMAGGDTDADGKVFASDFVGWATDSGLQNLYSPADMDFDGNVFASDFVKWAGNSGLDNPVEGGGGEAVYISQVPDTE